MEEKSAFTLGDRSEGSIGMDFLKTFRDVGYDRVFDRSGHKKFDMNLVPVF
jgi:hypothetical protein